MQKKLTIWIPTKNRPDFILRLLKYYSSTAYSGYLFIGDSSVSDDLEKNKETIKKFKNLLNIYYCEFPGQSQTQVSSELVPQIETEFSINIALVGEYNLMNIMAASAVSIDMGIPTRKIEKAIKNIPPIPGRLEQIPCDCPGKVFIDYAHTPDAYETLFSNLVELKSEEDKIITVFGCGGDRDTGKRYKMAKISETYAAFSFITMDNPRTESLDNINANIIKGFSGSNYEIIVNRKTAVETALSKMDDRSILLILGKGRENYQEIGIEKQPYSDIDIIRGFQHAG